MNRVVVEAFNRRYEKVFDDMRVQDCCQVDNQNVAIITTSEEFGF